MEQTALIELDEYPDEWIRVRLSGASVRQYNDVVNAYNEAVLSWMPEPVDAMCIKFAPFLVEWSYPEPCDLDGLRDRDINVTFATVKAWVKGVRDVPLPLPRKSSDGEPSEDLETNPQP